jgi:hypothetical protein
MVMVISLLSTSAAFAGTANSIKVTVNNKTVKFSEKSYIKNGEVMIPLRQTALAFGATVEWDRNSKTEWVHYEMMHIELIVGKNEFYIHRDADFSGIPQTVKLNAPVEVVKGRIFVPGKTFVESLGMTASWDSTKRVLSIGSTTLPAKEKWITMDACTVTKMELFTLDQVKIKDITGTEKDDIMKSFNEATIDQNSYIEMITGNTLKVTTKDGYVLTFTSYGSDTNVIVNFEKDGES